MEARSGILFCLLCVLPFAAVYPARADSLDALQVVISGEVLPHCLVKPSKPNLVLGDVSKSGSVHAAIQLNCNVPFNLAIESETGAFAHSRGYGVAGDFSTRVPYFASIDVPLDDGRRIGFGSCISSELDGATGCGRASSGSASAILKEADLTISWQRDTSTPLLAGQYGDLVTIKVEFAP
jgi:hypothetical protein